MVTGCAAVSEALCKSRASELIRRTVLEHIGRAVCRPAPGAAGLTALLALLPAIAQAQREVRPPDPAPFQAVSLLGDTLRTLPMSAATRARYEAQRDTAWRHYQAAPANMDSLIWYARRLGYLGQLREAIAVYTRGVALAPDNPWLYRHRGHRYLSVRDFPAAIRDLERAAALTQGKPDEVEPDGQPNPAGIPIGTLQSNIGYHLALAYYLHGVRGGHMAVVQRPRGRGGGDLAPPGGIGAVGGLWHHRGRGRTGASGDARALTGQRRAGPVERAPPTAEPARVAPILLT